MAISNTNDLAQSYNCEYVVFRLCERSEAMATSCTRHGERNKAAVFSSLRGRIFLRPRQSRNLLFLFRSNPEK